MMRIANTRSNKEIVVPKTASYVLRNERIRRREKYRAVTIHLAACLYIQFKSY